MYEYLLKVIEELQTCEFNHEVFVNLLNWFQIIQWTKKLDQQIKSLFEKWPGNVFEAWNLQFSSSKFKISSWQTSGSDPTKSSLGSKSRIDKSVHFNLNPGSVSKKSSGELKATVRILSS
ncbi:hypothetical protein BY996DRAFT_1057800 [Phakopsora pachyrhizi]|nr:hypothetical protein BY996DRAFT_1057800 [Phakopsora pachyrhizi]